MPNAFFQPCSGPFDDDVSCQSCEDHKGKSRFLQNDQVYILYTGAADSLRREIGSGDEEIRLQNERLAHPDAIACPAGGVQ
jgi:hypothetical protein